MNSIYNGDPGPLRKKFRLFSELLQNLHPLKQFLYLIIFQHLQNGISNCRLKCRRLLITEQFLCLYANDVLPSVSFIVKTRKAAFVLFRNSLVYYYVI